MESGTVFCLTEKLGSSAGLLGGALTWSQAQASVRPQLCLRLGSFLPPVYALEWQTLEKYPQGLTDYTGFRVTRGLDMVINCGSPQQSTSKASASSEHKKGTQKSGSQVHQS